MMIPTLMDHLRRLSAAFVLVILLVSAAFEVQGEQKSSPPPPADVTRSPLSPLLESSPKKNSPGSGNNPVHIQNEPSKSPPPPLINSEAPPPPSLSPPPPDKILSSPPPPLSGNSKVPPPPPNETLSTPPPPTKESSSTQPPTPIVKVSPPDHGRVGGEPIKPSPTFSPDEDPKCSDSNSTKCFDKNLFACFWSPKIDSEKMFVIFQNEGTTSLKLTVKEPADKKMTFELPSKKSTKKISVSSGTTDSSRIVISNGITNCDIVKTQSFPPSQSRLPQLPVYGIQMTPIYGAYAFFITILVAGGAWACCKFGRKDRRVDTGVPYQQLELGVQTQSTPEVDVEAAEGWDHWDDDWGEEETSSRPPQNGEVGNDSSNGHTYKKTSIKDEWEEWDD